jgi:hypothetical protein
MMFDNFLDFFGQAERNNLIYNIMENPYNLFLNSFAGHQFGNGLFTVFRKEDIQEWQKNVHDSFLMVNAQFILFGYDWMGNCLGIATDGFNKDEVIIFEIGTGEVLSTRCSFVNFLDVEIPNNSDACLSSDFYQEWLAKKGMPVKYGRCIGYKVPLFLGGKDEIVNLEESDMDVYWNIIAQIMTQIK